MPVRLPIAQTYSSLHLPLHNLPPAIWLSVRDVSDVPSVHNRDTKSRVLTRVHSPYGIREDNAMLLL